MSSISSSAKHANYYASYKTTVKFNLPVMRVPPPYYTPHDSTQNNHKFPEPYWYKNCPIAPRYQSILAKRNKDCEDKETGVDYKFAAVHRI